MADGARKVLIPIIRPKSNHFELGEDMKHQKMTTIARAIATAALPAALAACGGGSGGGEQPGSPTLKISGTAATGAAMARADVSVVCAAGTGTATTASDGTYTANVSNGALPCVLSATSGATTLHSILGGSGQASSVTANITPFSELLVAQFAGTDPTSFFTAFSSGTKVVDPAAIAAAQTALLNALKAFIDTAAISDIVGGTLQAGSHTNYDGVLDQLRDKLASAEIKLSDLTAAAALGNTTLATVVNTVLAPAAAPDCPGLKTGTLRYADLLGNGTGKLEVNTTTSPMTIGGQPLAGSACDYTATVNNVSTRILVSRSGTAAMLSGSGLTGKAAIAFPEQSLSVAALAGNYDRVGYSKNFDSFIGDYGDTVFSADGGNGLSNNCPSGPNACAPDTQSKGTLVANPAGGFDYMENGSSQDRVFAFRNASGKTLLLAQGTDTSNPSVAALVSKGKLALPAVGDASSYRQFTLNASGLTMPPDDTSTVTSVDSATGAVTRSFASDSHTDTLTYNMPFDGMRYRARNACTAAGGQGAGSCSGVVQLPFGGITLATRADSNISARFFSVSVVKP
ncbi:hypothetical protein GCM10010975_34530 [Comamonas phosphati]|nr:hypothetical protein GCM10010975_34530 [Comamonas phosphati]